VILDDNFSVDAVAFRRQVLAGCDDKNITNSIADNATNSFATSVAVGGRKKNDKVESSA
jgi:hypothetical protein